MSAEDHLTYHIFQSSCDVVDVDMVTNLMLCGQISRAEFIDWHIIILLSFSVVGCRSASALLLAIV